MLGSMNRCANDYPTTTRCAKKTSDLDNLLDNLNHALEKYGNNHDVLNVDTSTATRTRGVTDTSIRTRGRTIYGRNVSRDRSASRERIRRHSVSFDRECTLQSMSCYGKVVDMKESMQYTIREVFDTMVTLIRRNDYEVNYAFVRECTDMQDFIDSITRFMSKEVTDTSLGSFEVYSIAPGKYRGGKYFQELTYTHVINVLNSWADEPSAGIIRIVCPIRSLV
jgi:hypothetical protein